jgi:hypothetical protein
MLLLPYFSMVLPTRTVLRPCARACNYFVWKNDYLPQMNAMNRLALRQGVISRIE